MQAVIGWITFVLLMLMVLLRVRSLKKQGIEAFEFGQKDKKDWIIPPFALFYLYIITAHAFHLPAPAAQPLFGAATVSWLGVLACLLALFFFAWTLYSFKKSFRVGLVENTAQGLVTTGAFARSRNPIYLSFALMLLGQFLIFPSLILLLYFFAGIFTFHRQVLKEEKFLKQQYTTEFEAYCKKVRRYL